MRYVITTKLAGVLYGAVLEHVTLTIIGPANELGGVTAPVPADGTTAPPPKSNLMLTPPLGYSEKGRNSINLPDGTEIDFVSPA